MGFARRPPLDPGRLRQVPDYSQDEVAEVCTALAAEAPALWAVLVREAQAPASVTTADYDDCYDALLTWLFERRYVDTHIEMAMLFKAVRGRAGGA